MSLAFESVQWPRGKEPPNHLHWTLEATQLGVRCNITRIALTKPEYFPCYRMNLSTYFSNSLNPVVTNFLHQDYHFCELCFVINHSGKPLMQREEVRSQNL